MTMTVGRSADRRGRSLTQRREPLIVLLVHERHHRVAFERVAEWRNHPEYVEAPVGARSVRNSLAVLLRRHPAGFIHGEAPPPNVIQRGLEDPKPLHLGVDADLQAEEGRVGERRRRGRCHY